MSSTAAAPGQQLVFSYGSNSTAQLRARILNKTLVSQPAYLPDFVRCFCLHSNGWGGGGVASLAPQAGGMVRGSVVLLSDEELSRLDAFEGGYRRVQFNVLVGRPSEQPAVRPAIAYIAGTGTADCQHEHSLSSPASPDAPAATGPALSTRSQPFTLPMTVPPSEQYLVAIHTHLREHWPLQDASTLSVRSHDHDPASDTMLTATHSSWTHPGVAALSLPALCVEINARKELPWTMPRTIAQVVSSLAAAEIHSTQQLLSALPTLNDRLASAGQEPFQSDTIRAISATASSAPAVDPPNRPSKNTPAHIFVYGTLRPDFSPSGDKWGATRGCVWRRARVRGAYGLYQDPELDYPCALPERFHEAVVEGVVITWLDPGGRTDWRTLEARLRECDSIEGYSELSPTSGLYRRVVARVEAYGALKVCDADGVTRDSKELVTAPARLDAHIYYQERADRDGLARFESGNWLTSCSQPAAPT